MAELDNALFSEQELEDMKDGLFSNVEEKGPVTVLGKTFANDDERREYFREELRKKLPELRLIDGFPIGSDEDIITLSDPPFYTACPNPWINDIISEWESMKETLLSSGKRIENFSVKEAFASDVSEGKYNPLYLLHPYLTKVPYPAITKYLEHYTQPGDIVLDGFAGTGMTGAASRLCDSGSRRSICVDLSPLASFIGYFVNSDTPNNVFTNTTLRIIDKVKKELGWMLETKHNEDVSGEISYVIWSNVYVCPNCGKELVFYDVAFDAETGDVRDSFACTSCQSILSKSTCSISEQTVYDNTVEDTLVVPKRVPVLIGYTVNGKRFQKRPDEDDLARLQKINDFKIQDWIPVDKMINGDEINRASRDGIKYFEQYYTKRNLAILCKIKSLVPTPVFNSLITKVSFQSTIMYRYCTKGGGPMSGTMYIPALIKEVNIFNQLEAFIKDRAKVVVAEKMGDVVLSTQSSTSLPYINNNSIDYIFTDPPFGKNFMYSELNYISEMWLKLKTNNQEECIECKTQNKSISDYQSIMQRVFSEYYRVLKPEKWLSVEFSNTSAAIWNAIQNAITSAGFVIASVSALDKKKESYKAVTTTTAVKQDLVITCYKPSVAVIDNVREAPLNEKSVWDFIDSHLHHLPLYLERGNATVSVIERSPKILYDRLISYYVQSGSPVPLDASEFQKGLRERYIELDGMFFTAVQASRYKEHKIIAPEILPLGIIVSDEANGIEWLKNNLRNSPKTYQDLQPEWMQAINGVRKNDILPELNVILEENFIQEADGKWRLPNVQDDVDVFRLRTKALLKEFKLYVEQASKPKAKIKEVRVEAVRAGFKQCYIDKDFQTIVTVGNKIPQNLLEEDEILLQFYDIAVNHI